MTSAEQERRRIDEGARAYRAEIRKAKREYAKNLERERAILDEAERSNPGEFDEDIKNARALYDQAEREFYETLDETLRQFNAAMRQARRSVG